MATRSTRHRAARRRAQISVRSHNARSAEDAAGEQPQRGRGWLVGILVTAGVLAAIVVVALVVGGGGSKEQPQSILLTATPVEGATGALGITASPASYTVTYDLLNADDANNVADTAPPPTSRTYSTATETFRVQRPFATHVDNLDGAPPGNSVQQSIISDLGLYATTTAGDETQTVEAIVPGAGIGDWRLDAILDDAVADGTFQLRERRSLLGRECQVYRTGSPLENYQLSKPTDTTYADVCIDGAGLVLEQVAVEDGALLEHLTATAVDVAPTLSADDFAITGTPIGLDQGGYLLSPIDGVPSDPSYWTMSQAPPGYTLQGRYTWQQNATDAASQGASTNPTSGQPTTVVTSYVDVYTNGPDVVVVLQGPTSVEPSTNADPGADTTAGALGAVTIESKLTGSQFVAHPAETPDWFVQVSGTVDRSTLLDMSKLLNPPAPT